MKLDAISVLINDKNKKINNKIIISLKLKKDFFLNINLSKMKPIKKKIEFCLVITDNIKAKKIINLFFFIKPYKINNEEFIKIKSFNIVGAAKKNLNI